MTNTVLLIDDDEDDMLFFSEALDQLAPEMKLEYFSCGLQALEKLVHKQIKTPDVIFLDLNMPVLNGWECLKEIKKMAALQHIPVVMYSTANLHQSGLCPTDVGATAFYQKSNTFPELKNALSDVLTSVLHWQLPSLT